MFYIGIIQGSVSVKVSPKATPREQDQKDVVPPGIEPGTLSVLTRGMKGVVFMWLSVLDIHESEMSGFFA